MAITLVEIAKKSTKTSNHVCGFIPAQNAFVISQNVTFG